MSTNINVSILPKLHEKNSSSITDGGHLLHRIQVEHHNVCKTLKIQWKSYCVETFAFLNTINMGLNHFNGEHSVFEVREIMPKILKVKNIINILNVNGELMAPNLTIDFFLS